MYLSTVFEGLNCNNLINAGYTQFYSISSKLKVVEKTFPSCSNKYEKNSIHYSEEQFPYPKQLHTFY